MTVHHGGNGFVRERGGLCCNVRKCCVTICDDHGNPTGAEVFTCHAEPEDDKDDDTNPLDSTDNQPNNNMQCNAPLETFADVECPQQNVERMNEAELECMLNNVPTDHPWYDVVAVAMADFQPELEMQAEGVLSLMCEIRECGGSPLLQSFVHTCTEREGVPYYLTVSLTSVAWWVI